MTTDAELAPLLLDPTRLSIVSLLAATEWAEFAWVREQVELSDSALSKQLSTLANAEYIEVRKGRAGKRARTWISLSDNGRAALRAHIAALHQIAAQASRTAESYRPESGSPSP